MSKEQRLIAFIRLGNFFAAHIKGEKITGKEKFHDELTKITQEQFHYNGWFTAKSMENAIIGLARLLDEEELSRFSERVSTKEDKNIAVIMAGNIPAVGFHDLLCVLLSGHSILIKTSSDDNLLIPFICRFLIEIQPELQQKIRFADGKLTDFDAVIATGNNNTAQQFEYYFSKYPRIIRKNRNSVALLSGNESTEDLLNLGKDIFSYFGLGCRNVSKIFVPKMYSFEKFFEAMFHYSEVASHKKYFSNYEYHRTLFLLEKIEFLDNNFMILRENNAYSSPVAVVHYERYENLKSLESEINANRDRIQCLVGNINLPGIIPFGSSQSPAVNQFADNIDTLSFLNMLG